MALKLLDARQHPKDVGTGLQRARQRALEDQPLRRGRAVLSRPAWRCARRPATSWRWRASTTTWALLYRVDAPLPGGARVPPAQHADPPGAGRRRGRGAQHLQPGLGALRDDEPGSRGGTRRARPCASATSWAFRGCAPRPRACWAKSTWRGIACPKRAPRSRTPSGSCASWATSPSCSRTCASMRASNCAPGNLDRAESLLVEAERHLSRLPRRSKKPTGT